MRIIDVLSRICMNRRVCMFYLFLVLILLAIVFFVIGSEGIDGYTYVGIAFLNAAVILCVYEYACHKRLPNVEEEERIIRAWDRHRFVNGWEQENDEPASSSEHDRVHVV
jgi:hypothetical protein